MPACNADLARILIYFSARTARSICCADGFSLELRDLTSNLFEVSYSYGNSWFVSLIIRFSLSYFCLKNYCRFLWSFILSLRSQNLSASPFLPSMSILLVLLGFWLVKAFSSLSITEYALCNITLSLLAPEVPDCFI